MAQAAEIVCVGGPRVVCAQKARPSEGQKPQNGHRRSRPPGAQGGAEGGRPPPSPRCQNQGHTCCTGSCLLSMLTAAAGPSRGRGAAGGCPSAPLPRPPPPPPPPPLSAAALGEPRAAEGAQAPRQSLQRVRGPRGCRPAHGARPLAGPSRRAPPPRRTPAPGRRRLEGTRGHRRDKRARPPHSTRQCSAAEQHSNSTARAAHTRTSPRAIRCRTHRRPPVAEHPGGPQVHLLDQRIAPPNHRPCTPRLAPPRHQHPLEALALPAVLADERDAPRAPHSRAICHGRRQLPHTGCRSARGPRN
ncbi:MAG: hypothetical protein J3K34DRAFT_400274 [Monoraphidium minutum]|nr:MAG: hypothetical protein J3K34DRAFT_400274 [Monoraphidium minutum]